MKKLPVLLLSLGILIQLAALLGEHAEEIPFVIRIIAPSYYHAEQGFKILDDSGSLNTNSDGFSEISKILIEDSASRMTNVYTTRYGQVTLWLGIPISTNIDYSATNIVHSIDFSDLSIDNIKLIHGDFASTKNGKRVFEAVSFDLHSKKEIFEDSIESNQNDLHKLSGNQPEEDLQNGIEQLKRIPILSFCFGMFFFGTAIEIFAFYLETKESNEPCRQETNKN